MRSYIEIGAFPIKNYSSSTTTPFLSLLAHLDNQKDEFIEVYLIRNSETIRCILGVNEEYTDIALSVFSGFRYIVTPVDFIDEIKSCFSSIALHRKAQQVKIDGDFIYDYSSINPPIDSPTLSYLFSHISDGSGIAFVLGKMQDDTNIDPLRFAKVSISKHKYKSKDAIDAILSASKLYIACAFTFGDSDSQSVLASEMCFTISGWDYSFLSESINLLSESFVNSLDTVFTVKSLIRKDRILISDRRQLLLLRTVTESEFHSIISSFDFILDDSNTTPNLDTLWDHDAYSYFKKSEKSLCIGSSLYNNCEYHLARHKLRQGLLIVGSSGSGKGNQLFRIIDQLNKDGVPMLIFESAKQEMHHLVKNAKGESVIPKLKTWRPVAGQFLFNPFEIPVGLSLSEYRASLVQMLRTCFRLDGPLEELFVSTLNRCFYKANYTDSSGSDDPEVHKWGLHEFIIEYSRLIKGSGYSPKTKDDMRQAGLTRLKGLLDSNPDVYDTDHSISLIDLIKENTCNLIQLNSLPTIEAKQSLATMLLIALGAYMQLRFKHCEDQDKLRLVIIMDESHNLLKSVSDINGNSYSFADDFANLMLTLRSVGVGFIISDQTTTNIPKVITDACDSKMFMGSSKFSGIAEHLDFLGADDDLLRNLYRLTKGSGVFSFSGSPHCAVFQTNNYIDEFALAEDVVTCNDFMLLPESQKAATFLECQYCPYWHNESKCSLKSKQIARQVSSQFVFKEGNPLRWDYYNKQKEKVDFQKQSHKRKLYLIVKELNKRMSCDNGYCTFIQWLRICNLEFETSFTTEDILFMLKYLDIKGEI